MNDTAKIRRKRGRPTATKQQQESPVREMVYPFPSLDQILQLSDQQVLVSFDELGVKPRLFSWHDDDNQWNVALWHDHGLTMTDADRLKAAPRPTDKVGMATLRATALAIHQSCLRTELLGAYLRQWVESLDDASLVHEIERLGKTKLSESEIRYSKRADLQQQVSWMTWPVLVAASTLYVPLTNPLSKEEDQ